MNLDAERSFLIELAHASGDFIRPLFGRHDVAVELKGDLTPVTAADRGAEELLRRMIKARFPAHGILGEEFGPENIEAEFVWVLDPVDGTKSFVAGADVKQLLDFKTIEEALPLPNNAHLAFSKLEQMNKPVIAAVNGVALGGGNEFQLACHYTVAEPTAIFGQPEIRLNLIPGYGGTQRLPRMLALRKSAGNGE